MMNVAAFIQVSLISSCLSLVPSLIAAVCVQFKKAKLNFYLLLMNGVRVVFTKALAFSTVLTIRGLLF
ncbi:hypothetical protein CCH79_00014546 [Gambusia affinis]|uniref:G-protein coupled receptors family 1 profile domain-containing protein n=1 Tax=Gambusia affinis TaxID=33528 RepID=A0A315V798_GAMAF|nr:hypothetical protein CCH79_00014546 [Gambusia affinis]